MQPDLERKIAQGYVNPGWKPRCWAQRLRYLAGVCEGMHPEHAANLRAWADAVDRNHPPVDEPPVPVRPAPRPVLPDPSRY